MESNAILAGGRLHSRSNEDCRARIFSMRQDLDGRAEARRGGEEGSPPLQVSCMTAASTPSRHTWDDKKKSSKLETLPSAMHWLNSIKPHTLQFSFPG